MLPLLLTACASAGPTGALTFAPVADMPQPTSITASPGEDTLYVTEQVGRVWRVDPNGKVPPALVLDIRDKVTAGGELGLLGLAFAPKWPQDRRVFLNYTLRDPKLGTRVAAYTARADGTLDPASEQQVLRFDQPYANHNSGALAVGPDGFLYIGVGDGGSGGDPHGHGQNRATWLGSILRVDVSTLPYTVPADNPFVGEPNVQPEIWAYGVRNPWGMHFDGDTLWFADVGQNEWEEVNRGVAGGNYGWNITEGTHCYDARTCDTTGLVPPVAEYNHDLGQSVTGGVVYRGPSIPALDARYVYADFASGRIWAVPVTGGAANLVMDSDLMPASFGTDRQGRLYVGDYRGKIWRIEAGK
jgi:glucose/arabinose dehydrogenase